MIDKIKQLYPELTDADFHPSQAAVGDPAKFYTCIRSNEVVIAPEGIEAIDPEIGVAVCGGWA